jgi:hypothetical protein
MRIDTDTLGITHIFDGEEVVTGGVDGQVWIATFSCPVLARMFITGCRQLQTIDIPEL